MKIFKFEYFIIILQIYKSERRLKNMNNKILAIFVFMLLITTVTTTMAVNKNECKEINPIFESKNDLDWWPMLGHDPQHTGFSTSSAPNVNKVNWSYATDSEIRFSSSVVVDNKLYIGTGEIESKGSFDFDKIKNKPVINLLNDYKKTTYAETGGIFCIDTITGIKIWDFETQGIVSSTPVVYNGNVYVLTTCSDTSEGYLYCIDAETGIKQWDYMYTNLMTTPTIENDNLFITIADPYTNYSKLLCLNPSDGVEKWNHTTGYKNFAMYSAPAVYNDKVFYISINSSDIELHSVDVSTGEEQWTIFLTKMELGLVVSTPVVDKNRIFVLSLESYMENETIWSVLFCINAENGDKIWKHEMEELEISLSSPAIADDLVYFTYAHNYWAYGGLICIEASDGEVVWNKRLNYDFFTFGSPSIADEKLFIGGMNSIQYASVINCYDINSNELIWKYPIGEIFTVDSSAAIADGKVYIADYGGTIYAFSDNTPPNAPIIDGPSKGKKGTKYDYSFTSTDPDGDDIAEYIINWSDSTSEEIITGPFASGEEAFANHTWDKKGTYTIKAKAKDLFGNESEWSEFEVIIPRTKFYNFNLFSWFLERFPMLERRLSLIKLYLIRNQR